MKHYKSIDEAIEDFYHNNCINPERYLSLEKDAYCSCAKFLSQLLIIFDTNFRKIFSEFNTRNGGIFALRFFDI